MAKQLNVDLKFNADTSQAKAAIQTLIGDLNKLTSASTIGSDLPITKEILEAQSAARQLGQSLEKAFNTDTGKLDLTKFTQQLSSSGMSLTDYGNKLSMLGTEGDKAFLKLAQSIAATQAPLRQSSGLLANFATTLKNTARWQISSSILHGFMGTVQQAYGYAQDLNRSLNDIRIVTGQSAEQMDAFAARANKAAKELSTTTTAYTNASLIFYQQGLDDGEVQERTNVVIKMANASQQSAEVVSDQMTAVWNNFDDGSKSLEYYADVMTALGAATASSTSEIADGLEKFAAIADTVGLSYEYATAALATVTATTRQSADVVGTAFKTLFARIQDLELGETLDDGTTLGKYSEALASVGINIKNTSGEIKDMNQILDEMGDKWNDLSKDTQIALAQTVAGTRQYTQLVALMDNWDYFQENLGVANSASGTLQEQAEIYAESWEASKDRVRASAEEIYSSLIDDDFFIKLNDTFAKLLSGVSLFIDSLGGIKGVLPGIGILLTSIFKEDMANGINNALQNFKLFTGVAQSELSQLKGEAYDAAMSMTEGFSDQLNVQALRGALESTYNLQKELSASVKQMSPEQRKVAEAALESAQSYNAMAVEIAEAAEAADRLFQKQKMANEEKRRATMSTMEQHYDNSVGQGGRDLLTSARGMSSSAASLGVDTGPLDEAIQKYSQAYHQLGKGSDEAKAQAEANFKAMAESLRAAMDEVNAGAMTASEGIAQYTARLSESAATVTQDQGKFNEIKKSIELGEVTEDSVAELEKLSKTFGTASKGGKQLASALEAYKKAIAAANGDTKAIADAQNTFKVALGGVSIGVDEVADATARMANQTANGGKHIPVLTNEMREMATSAAGVAINNRNAGEAISTAGKKSQEAAANIRVASLAYQSIGSAMTGALGAMSSFAMGLNSLNSIYNTLNNNDLSTFEKTTSIMMSLSMGLPALIGGFSKLGNVLKFVTSAQKQGLTAQLASLMGLQKETMATATFAVVKNGEVISRHATAEAAGAEAAGVAGATVVTEIDTAATWANIAAKMVQNWYILLIVAALAALAAAIYVAVSAYNEEAAAAEQARGAIEECNEAQQDLQKNVEQLDNAWKSYDTAVEKLKKCTKGTDEWKEALSEVNGAALDVIDSLDGLDLSAEDIKALYNTDKGYMEIDTDKLQKYKDQMVDMAEAAEYAADFSKVYASKKTNSANLLTEMRKASSTQEYMAQEGYATTDSEGNYYGMVDEQKITDTILKNTEDWLNLSESEFSDKLKELGINVDLLSQTALSNLQAKVEELASSTAAASEKLLLIAKIKVEEELGDNYGEAEKAVASQQLANRTEELTDNWYDYLTSNSGETYDLGKDFGTTTSGGINKASGGDNAVYLKAVEALQAAGYNWSAFTGNAVLGDDNNRRFIFTDENGEQTKEKSAAWVAETIAASLALAELTGNAEQAGAALASMENKVSESGASAIKKMISEGNINSLTRGDLSGLKTEMDSDGGGDVSSDEAISYLRNAFADTGLTGDELDSYIATMFGKESIEEVGNSWSEIIAGTEEAWGNLADGFTDTVGNILNSIDTSSLSMDQAQDLGNLLTQAFITGGSEGAEVLSNMYTKAAEEGLGDEFIDALTGVDWTTITPEGLSEHLNDAGVAINFTDAELQNLINTMYEAAVGFEAAANKFKTLDEIIKTLKQGDTISAEQLEALGPGMEDYFMRMADGTYKLIGDAEAFYAAVNDQQMEGFENTITAKTEDNAAISNVLNHDIGGLGKMDSTTMGGHYYTGGGNFVQNTEVANAQLDFLEQTGYDPAQVQQWRDDMQAGTLDVKALTQAVNDQTTALGGAAAAEELLTSNLEANNTEIQQSYEAIASTAKSVDELNDMLTEGRITTEAYDKALQNAFEQEIESEGFDVEELNDYAEALMDSENALVETREEANRLAIAHAKMERGINNLVDNWDSWNEALENGSEKEKVATMGQMKKAMADIIGVDVDQISDKFINNAEAMDLMKRAAEGDMEALDALGPLFAKEYIAEVGINNESFQGDLATLQADLSTMLEQFQMEDIEIGTSLDTSGYAMAMTEMMAAAGTDIDTINSILAGMGFEPEITYVDIPVDQYSQMTSSGNTTWRDSEGNSYTAVLDTTLNADENGMVKVPVINGSKTTFKGGGSSAASSGAKKGGGGGGGGGSKPKKADTVKKQDVVTRYKEIDDKLDDIADKMDDASKAADRLWGPARLNQMKKVNEALEDEIDALKKKRKEAEDYLKQDKQDLMSAASENGVSFTFDANGNISNYDKEMTKLYNELDAAITAANADGNADESDQEKIDAIQERIDKVTEAIEQYDETRELVEDLDNDIQDKIYEWQDNNYEQLNYKLEFEIEINDSELELLEYYLGKTEGNIYKTAEAFGYMAGQTKVYNDNLKHQEDYVNELERAYKAGEISMDAYKEGLRESQSAMIENLQALQEQKEAMQEYYGEVMDMALEEISLYTDEMEELNSVLDHYSNILELVGKQEDYATKGKILQSKATNLRNEMQVQQELYEKSNAEAEKWAEKMATAIEGSNEYETYKKNWIAAQEAANEAQDNMLSKTEEWAEAMKAVVENELAGLAKTMEESLTGGTSFDELLTSMERRSSLQEEYLTTTNQIYETNKLMRQAQQEIDKTTNSVAKRKLANFISETEQMQNQTELSQYELDIQQAKYDLLLAEIALEEAQNAKSTVRLQRDSEGNFGYVYTADQSAVGEAEQNLADKQNALYNLGLEGANDYSQKYAETMQEAQDAITELTEMWMNGEIESEEEYQRRKAEIQDYYYEKLKQYSSLYQVALTTDSNVIKDAWSTDFSDMMYKTEDWKVATDDYFAGAAESMKTWAEVCGTVLEESGLDDVSKKVEEINTKSENLKNTLIGEDGEGGVVGAMMSEVEAAGKLSEAYIGIQNQIDEVIKKYEEMMGVINEDYTNENTPEVDPSIPTEPEPEEPTQPTEPEPQEPAGPAYHTGTLTFSGNGASRVWTDSAGNTYKYGTEEAKKMQQAFNRAYGANGGYKGDYWQGWTNSGGKLNAEVLNKKYGLATGGYTGDWDGSYGKLAFLHQKELVLNANDTENFLQAMDILDKIVSAIDLYSMNSQLGGALSSPSLGNMGGGDILEQQVHIEASFPGVQDRNEIEEAFNTLINRASQYANRK